MQVEFLKTRNVKDPQRDEAENAGIDFYIPDFDEKFINDFQEKNKDIKVINTLNDAIKLDPYSSYFEPSSGIIEIGPSQDVLIPSGIKSKFDNNIALIAFNKSGIATKRKLIVGACVVDSGYQGEIHIHLINTSNSFVQLKSGEKAVQFIPVYINNEPVKTFGGEEKDFYSKTSNRGSGGFGSTGTN